MTEKRFEVHSMIACMDIGETIDLEVCKNLIEKYGSSADIDLLITDNGKNMTYQEVCDLLNNLNDENKELKHRVAELELLNDGLNYALKYIRKIDVEIDVE